MSPRSELIQKFYESISAMKRCMGPAKTHFLDTVGLTRAQSEVLYLLSKESQLTIKQIADALQVTSSSATQLVEGLVSENYLVRTADTEDRRVVHVTLTRKGIEKFAQYQTAHLQYMEHILQGLTDDELNTMITAREKIITNLQKHLAKGV